jgi:NAD(P)-dependent dehydrogenase (short-subunit alcohol dehydrogenase family)
MRGVDGKNSEVAAELRALVQAEGMDLRVLEMDVTSDESVEEAAATVTAESGAPDVVINNAGRLFFGVTEAFTSDEYAEQLDVNMVGVHRVCRAFLPSMRRAGAGLIINVSSIGGRLSPPFGTIYQSTKWALEGYSLGLRAEVASSGVEVISVQPGPFTTSLGMVMTTPTDEEGRLETYPENTPAAMESMQSTFGRLFEDPNEPTDPQLVSDDIVKLVNMAPGTRPFRTVVGVGMGVGERNEADIPRDADVLETFGLTEFARFKV